MNYAVITIDTEAWHGDSPIDRLIWGKNRDGEHGLAYLIDLFEKHGVKAIFSLISPSAGIMAKIKYKR